MTRLHQRERVRAHEWHFHIDGHAVGETETGLVPEFLDGAEDVIPTARVESCRMLAQFVQDFFHLERREYGFDQHRRLDRALR